METNGTLALREWIRRKEQAIARCDDNFLQTNLRRQIGDLQRQLREKLAERGAP